MITVSPTTLERRQAFIEAAYRQGRTVVAHIDKTTHRDDLDRSFYVFSDRTAAHEFTQQDNTLRVHA